MKKLIITAILAALLPAYIATAANDNGNPPNGAPPQGQGGKGGKCHGKNGNGKPKKPAPPAPAQNNQ